MDSRFNATLSNDSTILFWALVGTIDLLSLWYCQEGLLVLDISEETPRIDEPELWESPKVTLLHLEDRTISKIPLSDPVLDVLFFLLWSFNSNAHIHLMPAADLEHAGRSYKDSAG